MIVLIGLLSDAHGNNDAFQAVWSQLMKEKCDQIIFLGDICGYYYFQTAIIDVLMAHPSTICLLGNHDRLFLEMRTNEALQAQYASRYGVASTLLLSSINQSQLEFLENLLTDVKIEHEGVFATHSSPRLLDEYIYPDTPLESVSDRQYQYVFLGHTHYAMDRLCQGIRFVNPGSCGQPRDHINPSYALVDTTRGHVEIKRVAYDRTALLKAIIANQESDKYLYKILMPKE